MNPSMMHLLDTVQHLSMVLSIDASPSVSERLTHFVSVVHDEAVKHHDELTIERLKGNDEQTLLFKRIMEITQCHGYQNIDYDLYTTGDQNAQRIDYMVTRLIDLLSRKPTGRHEVLDALRTSFKERLQEGDEETVALPLGEYVYGGRPDTVATVHFVNRKERNSTKRYNNLSITHTAPWFVTPVNHRHLETLPLEFYVRRFEILLREQMDLGFHPKIDQRPPVGSWVRLEGEVYAQGGQMYQWYDDRFTVYPIYQNGHHATDHEEDANPMFELVMRHLYWCENDPIETPTEQE